MQVGDGPRWMPTLALRKTLPDECCCLVKTSGKASESQPSDTHPADGFAAKDIAPRERSGGTDGLAGPWPCRGRVGPQEGTAVAMGDEGLKEGFLLKMVERIFSWNLKRTILLMPAKMCCLTRSFPSSDHRQSTTGRRDSIKRPPSKIEKYVTFCIFAARTLLVAPGRTTRNKGHRYERSDRTLLRAVVSWRFWRSNSNPVSFAGRACGRYAAEGAGAAPGKISRPGSAVRDGGFPPQASQQGEDVFVIFLKFSSGRDWKI